MAAMRRLLLTSLLAAGTALPAAAQGTEPLDLGEIVLSALRTAAERVRTGVSVSVLTEEDLAGAGSGPLSAVLSRLPGVSVVRNGPMGARTSLRIRGADPRYVAVYVDGIRVDDPTGIATEFDFGALSVADVGRVEVLRGSQSALWGGSAIGGVINITTRAAAEDGLRQSVAAEAGSHGTAMLRYALTYSDETVETAFTLSRVHSDGFSSYDTSPRSPGLEEDGFDATRLSFSARYHVSEALALGIAGFAQDGSNDYDGYGADSSVNSQDRREFGLRLFAEYSMGNTTHEFEATRYRVARLDHAGGFDSTFTGVREGLAWKATTEASPALTLVYGADTMEETAYNAALPAGDSTRISGVWAQGIWTPREDLTLSLSLRHDHNSAFGDQPSGRLAVAWAATGALTLRAAAATGFRAPSLYEQYGDPNWTIAANPDLTPEQSRSFEIGADYTMGDRGEVSVTLFHLDVEDAITFISCPLTPMWTCMPGTSNVYENVAGTSTRKGLELSGRVGLGETVTLDATYTYTDARDPSGAALLRVPRHALAMGLSADLSDRLTGRLGLQHVSWRPDEFGTPVDDYTVYDASFGYALTDAAVVSLRVENLFDKDYQEVPGYGTSGRAVYLGFETRF